MGAITARLQGLLPRTTDRVPSSPRERVLYALSGGLIAVAALAMLVYLATALITASRPFLGVLVSPALTVLEAGPVGTTDWPGLKSGLAAGDRLVSVNGTALSRVDPAAARTSLNEVLGSVSAGETVVVEAVAADGTARSASVQLARLPLTDLVAYFGIPFAAGVVSLLTAIYLFLWRRESVGAFVASGICAAMAVAIGGIYDVSTTSILGPLWAIATGLSGGLMLFFGLSIPAPLPIVYRLAILRPVALIAGVAAGVAAAMMISGPSSAASYDTGVSLALGACVGSAVLLLFTMLWQRRRAASREARNQSGIVLIGLMLSGVPFLVWAAALVLRLLVPGFTLPISPQSAMPFLLAAVLSFPFALNAPRRIDSDSLVSQSITHVFLLVALVIGYFLLTLGFGLMASSMVPDNPVLIAVAIFVIAALLLPVRARLQDRIDKVFFRQRRALQSIAEDFGQRLTEFSDVDKAISAFREVVDRGISPTHLVVFVQRAPGGDYMASSSETELRFPAKAPLASYLLAVGAPVTFAPGQPLPPELLSDKARIDVLGPSVIAGLPGSERLFGFVVLGPRQGRRRTYDYEDLRFLSALTGQLAVAIERAQSVETLEQRVKELDVLSSLGQASNFTRTLDDLLELISAQTNRLLKSDFQYIAFFDSEQEQLYFTFFLEEDERYNAREGRRWPLGNDIYSQILRSGEARRYEDYNREKQIGTFGTLYDSPRIRAWMGVPLVAQNRRLGVFALAKRDTIPYTADDMATFVNLAGLAATALEKAQLFDEVNARARQLGALNEVSQQLVAAEAGDVNTLLRLITESAVAILEAEAGSLLLRSDEDSDDMIFRVVLGEAEQELTGTRVSQDRGLVGAVLRTKQPQVANDTRIDRSWQGEVTRATGFRSNSIVAVPLLAKDRIIGVLEVLNKKNGQLFNHDEVQLLSTFASQAGVAIENARLFEMTGSALNQRLEELQTLASIDSELARALDQHEVAKITLSWASKVTGAQACVIGEVNPVTKIMRVLAIEGYADEDYPEGTEGTLWPLDRGIVQRVMRTRVADLADLRFDPDYAPSLRGAVSQITVPMRSGEDVIALLVLETAAEPFRLTDLDFVNRLTERASIALANAQLYERIVSAAENKSEFVAFAAHELKNPLTSIKGYSDTLLNPRIAGAMNEQQREQFVAVIRSNAERMQDIIDDLRDIAASDAGRLKIAYEPLQFRTVVEDTLESFQQQLEDKQQTVSVEMPPQLPTMFGDHKKLVQVMTNLISNAHKYSPPGSEMTVKVEVLDRYNLPNGRELGPSLYVRVRDSGIGMSSTDLKRIFNEDYFRSDDTRARTQKGTGLGMMITQRLVEGHGGRIWVESELDAGSVFQFVVPLDRAAEKPSSQTGIRKKIVMTPPASD